MNIRQGDICGYYRVYTLSTRSGAAAIRTAPFAGQERRSSGTATSTAGQRSAPPTVMRPYPGLRAVMRY